MKNKATYFREIIFTALFALVILAMNISAATFTVMNTSDSGADTINFDAGVFSTAQTITLAGGGPLIADSVDANLILNQIAGGKK